MATAAGLAGAAMLLATPAAAADCPNEQFRVGASQLLPDCRAYEQVSPSDKGNGGVGGGDFTVGIRTNPSGSATIWSATDAFLGAPFFNAAVPYSSQRSAADWTTRSFGWRPALPPNAGGTGGLQQAPLLMSEDGTKSLTNADRNPVTGEEIDALFMVDLPTGEPTQLTGQPLTSSGGDFFVSRTEIGSDPAFENVWFNSSKDLTDRALDVGNNQNKLYHYSVSDGELSLASFDPNGDPANGEIISRLSPNSPLKNYVSADGQVTYFIQRIAGVVHEIYRAEAGVEGSDFVTASENPGSTGPETGSFQGADTSGDRIFFDSVGELVPEAQGGHELYLYDHTQPEGSRLTLISEDQHATPQSADVGSAVGSSDDGSIIYFTANNQLIPGEDSASGLKLYRWEEGNLEFLARINAEPDENSYVSPDGRYAAFVSPRNLEPGVDTGGFDQVYRYDHQTGEFDCASCNPNGANTVDAQIDVGNLNTQQITDEERRFLSDNGRVFFMTEEALIPNRDTNEQTDVYTWHEGDLALISTGRSESPSRFGDASADGSSIYFTTRERLVGSDVDNEIDLYAARVNGGLEREQERTSSDCSGSACQGGSPDAPQRQGDATQNYDSDDQVTPAPPVRIAVRAQRVSNRGFTRVAVRSALPGRMVIQGRAIRNVRGAIAQPGAKVTRVQLNRKAKRLLMRRGQLRTKARVRFRAQGGGAAVRQVPLTFRLKGGNR